MNGIFTVTNGVTTSFNTIDGSAHNLITGDLVYILNYNSTDLTTNNEVNNVKSII